MRQGRNSSVPMGAASPNRRTINAISVAITCVVLFVSVQMSDSGFATHIKTMTKNLDRVLFEIMDSGKVNYTDFDRNVTYRSNNAPFNPVGMAGLYNLTNAFLKAVLSEDIDFSSVLEVDKNGDLNYKAGNETTFMMSFAGVATILVLTLIFLVFMPICGLCFCCCRCCGKCGARSKPCDKKRDLCKKFCEGTMLIVLTTMLLFCVVCAFASNQQFYEGLKEFPDDARDGVHDTGVFLDTTDKEMEHLLVNNYNEFKDFLLTTISSSSESIMDELKNIVNASVVDDMNELLESLPAIQENFNTLKNDSNTMRVYASQLNDAVRKLKKDLLEYLAKCPGTFCSDFNDMLTKLQTTIDFNKLPDLSEEIEFMKDLNLDELQQIGANGVGKLTDIQDKIKGEMDNGLKNAKITIEDAGVTIRNNLNDVGSAITDFNKTIVDNTYDHIDTAEKYIKQYGVYWYYGGLAMSCILLLITVCIALGLICGICGKRPDGYSDNCCNKGTGSQFLICGVMFMFLAGFVFAIVSLLAFSIGLFPQRLICYPMRNPADSKVLDLIDDAFDFKKLADVNVTLKELLENCAKNQSAYNVFNLRSKFDLDEAVRKFDVNQTLNSIDIDDILGQAKIVLLDDDNKDKLKKLGNLPYGDLSSFTDELNQNFTNYNLAELQSKLTELIETLKTLPPTPDVNELINNLEITRLHVDVYNKKLVEPMTDLAKSVIAIANNLTDTLKLNQEGGFQTTINNIIQELESTQNALNNEGKDALKNITSKFIDSVKDQINTYTDRIVYETKNNIGQCGPLSAVINATLISTCDKVLTPLTGFWFSMFASVILFLPTIIVSVKLANLYQKFKSNGLYVEAEYLYDAYAERDSIPLNSRGDKRNKKKNKKQKRYEERPSVAGDVVQRDYPGGSHGSDARYADMAPKQWEEFPAGGPPQYQRAPEYERPPPYYYPGASDQQ